MGRDRRTQGFEPGDRHTPPPVGETVERETTQPYARPVTSIDDVVELACRRRCEICQQEGGAMHALANEVKGLATEVKSAVGILAERKGEKRVWTIVRTVSVPILIAAATLIINHQASKRAEEQQARQARQAAEVASELRAFRAAHPTPAVTPAELPR